jgi:DNA-binding transcriptional LysR family regulator
MRYPAIDFTILSRPSTEIPALLENLEIDAAITYLETEAIRRMTAIPLYRERYQLLASRNSPLGKHEQVTWRQVSEQPLCLLTPDTQNRQLIESLLRSAGGNPRVSLESDSMMVLFAHVKTGSWVSVMPKRIASALQLDRDCAAIPIVEPDVVHTIGLVTPARDRSTPLAAALATEARSIQNLAD